MFALAVDFEAKREHAAAFLEVLKAHAANCLKKEPACKQFDVSVDVNDPFRIFLYEVYDDMAAIEEHRKTPHFATFAATIEPMVADRKLRTVKVVAGRKY